MSDIPALPSSQRHLTFLDCLRALAALYVLVSHASALSAQYHFFDGVPPRIEQVTRLFTAGHLAVDLFIVLSGFSLMLGVLRKNQAAPLVPFLTRRAQRILPPYYAALALPLVLNFVSRGYLLTPDQLGAWSVCSHLLLLQDLFANTWNTINNILWSVSVEWRIYLLFPVFSYLCLRYGLRALLAAALLTFSIAVSACRLLHLTQVYAWTGICPQYLILFALGMACATVRFSDKPRHSSLRQRFERIPSALFWVAWACPFAVFVSKAGILWKLMGPPAIFLCDGVIGVFATALMLRASYSSEPGKSRTIFSNTHLARIGLMIYSIYLVHYPILQLCANLARDHAPTNSLRLLLLFTVGIGTAYATACGFYRWIERPFARPARQHPPEKGAD